MSTLQLTILVQPAQVYRLLNLSAAAQDKGWLLSRDPQDSENKFLKVQISGIDPAVHYQLELTVCTVNADDRAPHPYYLYGDHCNNGYFEKVKLVNERGGSDRRSWIVSFDKLSLVRVPKESIGEALQNRKRQVPQLDGCPITPSVEYDERNVGRIRLAFSLFVVHKSPDESFTPITVFSDVIHSEDDVIAVERLNPVRVPIDGGNDVAIYVKRAIKGIDKTEVKIYFSAIDERTGNESDKIAAVESMNPHLLVVKAPDFRDWTTSNSLKCRVTARCRETVSRDLEMTFDRV